MNSFLIRIAEKKDDLLAAQRLRFDVFNREMGKGLASSVSSGLDCDEYDALCDHLLVVDAGNGIVVGTYRLLLRSRLKKGIGFYSEREFDLGRLLRLKGEILELGRSCVHRDYRNNRILRLLWGGILRYVSDHRVHYMIGCPSLYTRDIRELSAVYALMRRDYWSPSRFRVFPHPENRCNGLDAGVSVDGNEKRIFLKLPSLLRSYLKVGARVCGAPAVDEEFGTVDLFILLDTRRISAAYLRRLGLAVLPPVS